MSGADAYHAGSRAYLVDVKCHFAGGPATVFVPCDLLIPPEASVMYTKALLSMVAPEIIICITDMPQEALMQCSCNSSNDDFYQLPNSKATELNVHAGAIPRLPPGCIMTGCSAALLCAAEV